MKIKELKINKVIVHSGTFHADDVMVVAMVKALVNPDITVDRVPHQSDLTEAQADEKTLVADVGRIYDESKMCFDHHQFKQPEEESRAAAGMVLDFLHKEGVIGDILYKKLKPLINKIDANDIGVRPAKTGEFPALISGFNRFGDEAVQEAQFQVAVALAVHVVLNYAHEAEQEEMAVEAADSAQLNEKLGVLKVDVEGTAPYLILDVLAERETPADIIYWEDPMTGEFKAQVIPDAPESFGRKGRGFNPDVELPKGIKFVHKGQFFMVAETEGALLDFIKHHTL